MEYIKSCAKALCDAVGVGGERQVCEQAQLLLKPYTKDISVDAMGNIIATIPSGVADAPVVLLEAHMDEIGFVVTTVTEDGFLQVACCGGVDKRCLTAAPVTVWTECPLNGVFCSTPPHLNKEKENNKVPDEQDLYIDLGLPADEVKRLVKPGTRVSFAANFAEMTGECITSKALDNRAGMTAILYALSLLKNNPSPYNITVLFSVQEELGCRGAQTGSFAVDADFAIVTDVSFAHTPDSKKELCGELGEGAMIGVAPTLSQELSARIQQIAAQSSIPYQIEVMGGKTGTDADVISVSRHGIPTALLSIPLRYMHTPVETVSCKDIAAVGTCMAAYLRKGWEE